MSGGRFYLILGDFFGILLVGCLSFALNAIPLDGDRRQLASCIAIFVSSWIVGAYLLQLYGEKAVQSSGRDMLVRAAANCFLAFGIFLFIGFGLDVVAPVSRIWVLTWAASVLVWAGLARVMWRAVLRRLLREGRCLQRALVLARSAEAARRLTVKLEGESRGAIRVVAAAALPGRFGAPTLDWVEGAVREACIDRVIIGEVSGAMVQASALLSRLRRLAIDVTLLPDLSGWQAPVATVDRIGTLPAIDLSSRPLTPGQVRLKRCEDLILGSLLIVFVLPLLAVVAVAIKLDSAGPVLFRQMRSGLNSQPFEVWKFRTMYTDVSDYRAARQTSRQDSRVTRVGRFLRRTSIDELPQLFNVIAGDMSIVGPRPHALGMTAVGLPLHEVSEDYAARHRLKPGITGWAQVNGSRGEVDSHEKLRRRVALDCYYIENWSLGFDLSIIARTVTMVLSDPNAY